jgi:hypothetical protein
MYVGGGLYLPTSGTASKTSTPTGGTVTVAQRNAIASAPKSTPVASSVTKKAPTTTAKPTTNTLSSMAGSSLGTTSTKTKPASSTASLVTGSSSAAAPRNTAAQNAAVASLLSGAGIRSTGGINAALPQPPQLTKAQIGNRFTQSLASGASTGAAVPNPAGLTRDEADTLRSRFYKQFYSGQPVQRIADKPVPVSYDYMFSARNDDKPYVSPYDAERYGVMSQAPGGLLPSNQFGGSLNGGVPLLDTAASNISATLGGAANALFGPGYGMIVGAGKALQGGPMVQNFGEGFVQGEGDVRQLLNQIGLDPSLNPGLAGNAADIVNVGSFAGMLPGVGAAMRTAAMRAGAGIPRTVAVIPQAAGIDAALTPRQAQFRQLMDEVYAGERAATAAPTPAVSAGPRIPPGGSQPVSAVSPAEIARLENILGNLGYSAPRPAAAGARLPGAANVLDEGFVSRAAAANDDRLLANMMRENDVGNLSNAINENDAFVLRNAMRENDTINALNTAAEDALRVGPTLARAEQLAPPAPTGRNAFSDIIDEMEAAKAAKVGNAEKAGPYVAMSADEAANVLRPGPRVAADKRMDPFTKNMLLIAGGGAGVALPGLAGLSLLANGQLGPAPLPVGVPDDEQRGIDAARVPAPVSNETLNAFANSRGSMSTRLPGGAGQVLIPTQDGTVILPAPNKVVPAVEPSRGSIYPAWVSKAKGDAYNAANPLVAGSTAIDNFPIDSDTPITAEEQAQGGGRGAPASGEQGEADTAAPAAGTKFTPGPGQFVGTNGYIYEQSSDGSFENVGRVPGYTPAQLSEAANKGAFRDPNNIVTGGAKPRKQARKKGERTFFDDAGDFLKDRFDDSVYGKLSKLFFPDDAAAPEAAATGPEAVEYYSTPPAGVSESLVSSSGSSKKKRKPKDETDTGGTGTGGTGTGGTGTSPYTPEMQAMLNALYGNYMRQYNGPGVGYVPGVDPERNYFTPAFADGGLVDGRLVLGDGGPKEDKIPAMIDGVEQAKLSNGEFVMTAAAVKNAGGGDIELGAKRLMDLNNMLSYGKPADQLKVQHVK